MLNVFKCPACRRLIETNQTVGQTIPCPYCSEVFQLQPKDAASRGTLWNAIAKVCIPLGYVLFVAVPFALTVWYFTSQDGGKPKEAAEAVANGPAIRDEKKAPRPVVRPPRPEKGSKLPAGEPPSNPTPDPDPVPEPPRGTALAVAPLPREVPEVPVAPEPHPILWKFPLLEYSSNWQKVGSVDVRVAGLAVTRVPFIDAAERITESAAPLLVVLVEVRLNATGRKRELLSWTQGPTRYGVAYLENGKDLAHALFPPGGKPNTGLAFKQPLPDDGTPVRDVLLFAVPPTDAGELSLRLDGTRCGETKDIWFKIPATALKK